jgi:beta-1,4-mannosyltransferase
MEGNVSHVHLLAEEQVIESLAASDKKNIYVYPITPFVFQKGANNYILKLIDILNKEFTVINKQTRLGIFDMLLKLPKCNIIYFNWIADIADKRFGYIQIPVLFFILVCCKILNIQIAWFVHNDISHTRKHWFAKKVIRRMMMIFSDVTFTHSNELSLIKKMPEIKVFEHPVDEMPFIENVSVPSYDVLIWGSVSPYKGVREFTEFNFASHKMHSQKILIAGKFASEEFYNTIAGYKEDNLELINKVIEENELMDLFAKSRYIVFCYRSASVLSSAALCKTLSYGKTIVGPNIGSFKELGKKGLIYTYDTLDELADLLEELKTNQRYIDQHHIKNYIQNTSWSGFRDFLVKNLKETANEDFEISTSPATM